MRLIAHCGVFCASIAVTFGLSFSTAYGPIKEENYTDNAGLPLFLTPLIKSGKIEEAQKAAEVKGDIFLGVKSYSGYLTVDVRRKSNLFFWFFPAQINESAPVLLWLQGGPGTTSLLGLFVENGPFHVTPELTLSLRNETWSKNHSIIYIDNPVGTGYSFTRPGGYCQNETIIGAHLYEALLQFFQLFPNLQKNDFFVAGESYGGKYAPAVAYTIHKNNPSAKIKINLKGVAIGNGLSDPENQLIYSEYLFQIGLIDGTTKELMEQNEQQGIQFIREKKWSDALRVYDELLNGELTNQTSLFKNITGFDNYFNYLIVKNDDSENFGSFVQQGSIRAAIHVGNATFHGEDKTVLTNLIEDTMQSIVPWISELLEHYKFLNYNGQLDIIVPYPSTLNYLKKMQFAGREEYKTAKRVQWYVGEDLAGYVKQGGNLTEVLVRNAGHMVPKDQPLWALDLITRFTYNKGY